jgi:hypothetical protein
MGGTISWLTQLSLTYMITTRHALKAPRSFLPSRLEDTLVGMFSRPVDNQVYVHWGPFESGKSTAAYNAAYRLQQMGSIIMFIRGYDFYWCKDIREWLRLSIGLDKEIEMHELYQLLPAEKRKLVILDHADMALIKFGSQVFYSALKELNMPTLVFVSSWEHVVDLQNLGAELIGQPGFSRWTRKELSQLYNSLNKSDRECVASSEVMEVAVLAGCPGELINDAFSKPNMLRAKLIDAEWKNGIRALNGKDMKNVKSRFPDKNGVFHWDGS